MAQTFNPQQLIEAAQKLTGLDQFDSDSFYEGLSILLADANKNDMTESGVKRFGESVTQILANRLKVTHYLAQRPELSDRPIERPIFVFGVPRTGTTLLSNLLAADPARRSPLTWEIDDPVPPPTTATLFDDPRALARLQMEKQMLEAAPEMGKYYRSSAIYPNECVYFMAHDFKTLMLESRGKLPNYRDWLLNDTDMSSAYQYHKKFLQLLQADAPGVWNLKMPSHALWLETLIKIYPDARLVWAHRDPLTATSSFCSLISLAHLGFTGKTDTAWIAENCPYQAKLHADRIMDFREKFGEDRIIDVHYADLINQPIASMEKLYGALGDEFSDGARRGVQGWIDDNPQNKFGKHEYRLAEFGLTAQDIEAQFERYLAKYDVAREG
ncbi:sulfotransferase family protein [Zhongshania aquimaris]|uniref:Sulfotransferase n=1 Tax=Zhongshania aquimaris TaxID=2857107 RepID=A0ABS6VW25_9GAMM|nr:sulfotransferase [Zhongshania aquimaris]MBW2942530.1 sulfotransferase [Zhongshania aquimaris]